MVSYFMFIIHANFDGNIFLSGSIISLHITLKHRLLYFGFFPPFFTANITC